jgi:predicted nucleic acid-binding protein
VILLDTSVLSTVLRRRQPGAAERALTDRFEGILKGAEGAALPGVVLQELLSGIPEPSAFGKLKNVLLRGYAVITASVGDHVLAAEVVNRCRRRRRAVSSIDALITAMALNARAPLFTTDADFKHISRIVDLRLLEE